MPSPQDFLGALLGGGSSGGPGSLPTGGSPGQSLAMSAMDQLTPGQGQNASGPLQRVDQALTLAHKLILSVLPQIAALNPRFTKDLHQIGRQLLQTRLDVNKDLPIGSPPELMAGLDNMEGAPPQGGGMGIGSLPGLRGSM